MRGSSSSRLRRHYATIRIMNATSTSTSSGWNRGTSTPKPAPKKPSPILGIVAGLVVVALGAGIVAWLFKSGEAESLPLQEKKPTKIKTVTPAPAPKPKAPPVVTNKVVKKAPPPKPDFMDKVPYSEMTPLQKAIRADYYAFKVKSFDPEKVVVDHTKYKEPCIVDDPVQMEFLKYFEVGTMQPPTGRVKDQAALAAIIAGVPIKEDDPPEVVEKKKDIQLMLDDLKEYMKQGHSAQEYFDAMDRRQETEAATMEEARRQVNDLINSGDEELAAATIRKFNEYLNGKGLPAMKSVRYRRLLEKYQDQK